MRFQNSIVFVALALGCGKGAFSVSPGDRDLDAGLQGSDAGGNPGGDADRVGSDVAAGSDAMAPGTDSDASTTPADAGPDATAACDPADCGPGASCGPDNACVCDEGLLGDPTVGCSMQNPCESVTCPSGASCNPDGSCSCDPFFTDDGAGGCTAPTPPADLSTRTKADVCDIWTSSHTRTSQDFFLIEPVDECDPGVLHPEEMRTALHITSVYRMLVGLYPVSTDHGHLIPTQACATTHAAQNMGLDHSIPTDWACYTQEAADGAGSSNLARGVSRPAATVGLYVGDVGVDSLGHRRWIFNPSMLSTAFGHREQFGCMYAFSRGRNHSPDFVAYPAPGPFPRDALMGKWSISGGGAWTDNHTVTITNMTDGSDIPATGVYAPAFSSLPSTLAWSASAPTDTPLRITISEANGTVVQEYTTTLVTCP